MCFSKYELQYFCVISDYLLSLEQTFSASHIFIIIIPGNEFVVVMSVSIKRADCKYILFPTKVYRDHCESAPCLNGGTCINTGVSFNCTCDTGFHGDVCDLEEDACQSSPCLHGRCLDLMHGFMCR